MMRTATPARTLVAPASARATQAISITAPPPEACDALAQMGDAVALIDRRAQKLRWTSPAWLTLLPEIGAGTSLQTVEQALPGLAAAHCAEPLGSARRLSLGDKQQWDAQLATFDAHHLLLRLSDRREVSRAMPRQLDDRRK